MLSKHNILPPPSATASLQQTGVLSSPEINLIRRAEANWSATACACLWEDARECRISEPLKENVMSGRKKPNPAFFLLETLSLESGNSRLLLGRAPAELLGEVQAGDN